MVLAGGAISAGIGALSALLTPSNKPKTGVSSGASFEIGNSVSATQVEANLPTQALSPVTFNAALSAQSDASASSLDKAFAKIDTNGDGSISKDELAAALTAGKKKRGHRPGQQSTDPLLKALDSAYQRTKTLSASSASTVSVTA